MDAGFGPSETRLQEDGLLYPLYSRTLFAWSLALLPTGMSPNAITVVGQLCAVAGAVCAYWASRGDAWLYGLSALLHFSFMLADNLDGMHARKTGQVSRVGELLDHGMDGIASIAILLTIGFVTRADGLLLFGLAYAGTLAFVAAYWEQYRTGLLVCPAFGQLEGVTLLAAAELLVSALDLPPSMQGDPGPLSVGSVLTIGVSLGYLDSARTAIQRAGRAGTGCSDLIGVAAALGCVGGYVVVGSSAWLPAALVGVTGAEVVVRSLRHRKRGQLGRLLTPRHVALLVPLGGVFVAGGRAHPAAWTALAAGVALSFYAIELREGIREMSRL